MRINEAMPVAATRRTVLLGLAAMGLVLSLGRPALADPASDAKAVVQSLAQQLTQLVNGGRSAAQVTSDFQAILSRYADMPAIAASALGQPWRGASAAQKQNFVAAFQSYIANRYGKTFRDYKNVSIDVTGAKDGGKAGILVQTNVKRPGQDSVNVDWQVSAHSGSPKVVNLVIEGVSMLATERAEIGSMLDASGGDLDTLIAQLRKPQAA